MQTNVLMEMPTRTIAEQLQKADDIRLGNKSVILRAETAQEQIWREEKIFKYVPKHNKRLTMTYVDKSVKHFSVIADHGEKSLEDIEVELQYAVQEMVDVLKLGRVVWRLEGGNYHISSHETKLPNRQLASFQQTSFMKTVKKVIQFLLEDC